jgi:DNA-binding HxlR family transcriptional regulator
VLAALHRADAAGMGGARLAVLCYDLDAGQGAVRQSLDHLIAMGLTARNTGHGHPLRPEYILTRRGAAVAPACAAVDDLLVRLRLREAALRRWSLPALNTIADLSPARFTTIASRLDGITDRALSQTLKTLSAATLVARRVDDGFPPAPLYTLGRPGEELAPLVAQLA